MSLETTILLIITGGTLDKQYQETTGELIFLTTHLPLILKESNCTQPIQQQILMQKDSLEMTRQDRQTIYQACLNTKYSSIVITHGTDTMVETARYLQQQPDLTGKKIVLTGAMRPFMLGHSDAAFNIGASILAVQLTKAGVYICMNGQLFPADNVTKNRALGQFI